MKKTARKTTKRTAGSATGAPAALTEVLRSDLREFVISSGMKALELLLEEERTSICGPRYAHDAKRRAGRGGHAPSALVLGGRRVSVRRPRARTRGGREAILPSWRVFGSADPLSERAVEQMTVGVATRKYARSLEPLPAPLPERGTSKSAVSRRFVERTESIVAEWMRRDLSALDVVVLMIDGIHVGAHVMLAAVGIDVDGKKHVLGIHEGATENAVACSALLTDLRDRGMRTDRSILVVIDGGKGLRAAIRDVFGSRAVVQRCQVHKMRNVAEHLPQQAAEQAKRLMRNAYRSGDAEGAEKQLRRLANHLRKNYPSAAGSLDEGLEETLTVMRMELPRALERTLSTTNPIENLMSLIRHFLRRVRRWKDGSMIERWTAMGVLEAQKKFRRLKGHVGMPKLVDVLRARDAKKTRLASVKEAA
jgi:transposase-like protein